MPQDNKAIRLALRAHLFAQVSAARDAFLAENRRDESLKTNDAIVSVVESFIPASEVLIATNTHEGLGRVQYDVLTPKGRGASAAEDLATLIQQAFRPPNVNITLSDSSPVCIDRAERFPARDWDDTFYAYAVSIGWRYYS